MDGEGGSTLIQSSSSKINESLLNVLNVRHTNSHTAMNNNGNNVDMDMEMAKLAENQLMYNYLADRVSGHYSKIRTLMQDLK